MNRAARSLRGRVLAIAAVAMLVAGCGASQTGGGSSTPPSAAAATTAPSGAAASGGVHQVAIAHDAKLGDHLTGEGGKSLYVNTKDSAGASICTGACAATWPPFTLDAGESVVAGTGVTGTLSTFARADGSMQVTYDGAPLYYFGADTAAGDTNGQGINGVWFVASPAGGPGGSGGPAASPAASKSGYSY